MLAVGAALLYSRTLAPSLGGTIDSAEFQQAAYSLAIAHPTGYPLYLLVARVWISIIPFGDAAFRVNLLSLVFAALAVWVLYEITYWITRNVVASAGAAGLFAVQAVPWAQASVAEINSLNTLLTGLCFLSVLLWAAGRLPVQVPALTCGLAVSHHRTALLYVPLLLAFAVAAVRWGGVARPSWRGLLAAVALFLSPFALYIYLPLRAHTNPSYPNNWQGFVFWFSGESAVDVIQGALDRPLLPRLRSLLEEQVFWGWPGRVLFLLGIVGAAVGVAQTIRHARSTHDPSRPEPMRRSALLRTSGTTLCFVSAILGLVFATLYDILDVSDYLGVPLFMWCVTVGAGLAWAMDFAGRAAERLLAGRATGQMGLPISVVGLLALVILCWATARASLARPDIRVDFSGLDRRAHWQQLKADIERLPDTAVLIADWPEYNEALYFQRVEGWRANQPFVVTDAVLAAGDALIEAWHAEGRQVYLLGPYQAFLSRYGIEQQGALLRITGRQQAAPQLPMEHALNWRFGTSIILLGYTIRPDPPVLDGGGLLHLTLYWTTTKPVSERYVVFNHVVDGSNRKVGQKDDEPGQGLKPTVYWEPGQVISDTFPLAILPDTRPGTYRLMSGLYTRIGGRRLPAFTERGEALGDYPQLATVTIR